MELDTIVCGDCLDVMANMPDGCADLVVTSPPYGDMYFGLDIEKCKELIQLSIKQIERILTPGGKFVINVDNYVTSKKNGWKQRQIIPMTKWIQGVCNLIYQDEIFWLKGLPVHGKRTKPLFGSYPYPPNLLMSKRIEYVLVWGKPGRRKISKGVKEASKLSKEEWREWTQNLWTILGEKCREHVAPFPEELIRRIIKLYSFVGDCVFDPFIGSGTTAVAALKLGRHFYGCDINSEYVELANKRIKKAQLEMAQMEMFA